MRPLATLAAVTALAFVASPAPAETLYGNTPDNNTVANCTSFGAEVLRWTPADGPPAAFVSRAFVSRGGNLWIGLGYDRDGFWSAESNASSDACDDCDDLQLAHTAFGGARTFHAVTPAIPGYRELPVDQREGAVRRRLFTLAATVWPATRLSHDYALRLPAHDAEGHIERFTGWMAEVSKRDAFLLRFGLRAESFMCWCSESWTGYRLAGARR